MDELAAYNKARWEELALARVVYTQPWLDLDARAARQRVDPHGVMGEVQGLDILCLAASGGQQSAAFGLLGARVTVFDLSETQLARDQEAATHYGLEIRTVQGDMRDLSAFPDASFDLVWHAYSINFVPQVAPVFQEVRRVLRPGGLYRLEWANPFTQTIDEASWNGEGYLLGHPYRDGACLQDLHPTWNVWDVYDEDGTHRRIASPREYVHTLSTVVNGLVRQGFVIIHASEAREEEPDPAPGSWAHFTQIAPPWLTFWCRLRPEVLCSDLARP